MTSRALLKGWPLGAGGAGIAPAAKPSAIFTQQPTVSPSSGMAGTTVFTATPGQVSFGGIVSRNWLLNGTSISTSLVAAPQAAGVLTYQEFAQGAGGGAASAIVSVSVVAPVRPTLNALTVSNGAGTVGAALTSTVSGTTNGSTLSLSGAGAAGLSVSGTTISGTPTTAGAVNVIETLNNATNSPRTTSGLITIAAASGATPHQLLQPSVTESTASDTQSVAYQVQLQQDNQLPQDNSAGYGPGYMGFALKVERALDSNVTSASPGYVSETRVINTPMFNEGVADMAIVKSLSSGQTYYFAFSVIAPSGAETTYPQSPRTIKTKVVPVGMTTTFDTTNSGAGFVFSNSNKTVLSTSTSSDGRLAVTTDSVALGTGQSAIQFRLDANAANPADYQIFGLTMSTTGAPPNFFYDGTGSFRCDNQIDFVTPAVNMQWRQTGSPEALVDSGITVPDNNVLMIVDQGPTVDGPTKLTIYVKNKMTPTYTVFNGNPSGTRAYVAIKQPGQVTIVPTSVKPNGVQDWVHS